MKPSRHDGATLACPACGPSFACPAGWANRKGSVEKSVHYVAQRCWPTVTAATMVEAHADLDRLYVRTTDRPRPAARLEALLGAGAARAEHTAPGRSRTPLRRLAERKGLLSWSSVAPERLSHPSVMFIDRESYRMGEHRARAERLRPKGASR